MFDTTRHDSDVHYLTINDQPVLTHISRSSKKLGVTCFIDDNNTYNFTLILGVISPIITTLYDPKCEASIFINVNEVPYKYRLSLSQKASPSSAIMLVTIDTTAPIKTLELPLALIEQRHTKQAYQSNFSRNEKIVATNKIETLGVGQADITAGQAQSSTHGLIKQEDMRKEIELPYFNTTERKQSNLPLEQYDPDYDLLPVEKLLQGDEQPFMTSITSEMLQSMWKDERWLYCDCSTRDTSAILAFNISKLASALDIPQARKGATTYNTIEVKINDIPHKYKSSIVPEDVLQLTNTVETSPIKVITLPLAYILPYLQQPIRPNNKSSQSSNHSQPFTLPVLASTSPLPPHMDTDSIETTLGSNYVSSMEEMSFYSHSDDDGDIPSHRSKFSKPSKKPETQGAYLE